MRRLALPLLLLLLLTACASKPPWEKTDPDQQADAYANLGMGYLEQEQYSRSLWEFGRALDLRPRHTQALHGMALTLQSQGENQLAENYFKQVLQVDPKNTAARNNYAAFLFEQSRYDEARAEFELASKDIFYPNRAMIFENLGYVALEQDKPSLAIEYFQRCLALDRNRINAHRELLRLQLPTDTEAAKKHWQFLEQAGIRDRDSLELGLELAKKTGNQQEKERLQELLSARQNDNNH
ncbi:type IV pilus biogenesis/stability protein PilW [Marinospirillum sp.]|uniref:type IV pilus biogenesis/stability protein PilW n=1 Tax=Marinospirillum sp. TaxID=2183934 RepID=UPI0028707C87|nr:type IV pilus biogenesis/stability protein PilW [Marinospirillum sp.]MDR9468796.1 type IV pilus biogenesis/stability protein PilW [Marinospirillum sp.]